MVRTTVFVAIAVLALASCKGGGGGSGAKCQQHCAYEDEAGRQVERDLGEADRFAKTIEDVQPKTDDDAKREGAAVAESCGLIHTKLAHAQGILWALHKEREITERDRGQTSSQADDLEPALRATATCNKSPAQLKADVVPLVHGLKKIVLTGKIADCESRCKAGAAQ